MLGEMTMSEHDLAYHRERFRTELDHASRAQHVAAADAHRDLARLHLQELKKVDERCNGSGLGHR